MAWRGEVPAVWFGRVNRMPLRDARRQETDRRRGLIHTDRRRSISKSSQLDRAELLRLMAGLVKADGSVSGITIITPDGELPYVDADMLRRSGGRA